MVSASPCINVPKPLGDDPPASSKECQVTVIPMKDQTSSW